MTPEYTFTIIRIRRNGTTSVVTSNARGASTDDAIERSVREKPYLYDTDDPEGWASGSDLYLVSTNRLAGGYQPAGAKAYEVHAVPQPALQVERYSR